MQYCILDQVLFLARSGFRIVPAAGVNWQGDYDKGKQPLVSIHEASSDAEVIKAWAAKYNACNWLYVPGDGQAVLDVDPRHAGDVLLRELEAKYGPLPLTSRARTGGGGWHYYLTAPAGLSIKCDIAGNHGLTLGCGGKMGFVVPPCRHVSGNSYAWELAPWDVAPAPAPAWLLASAGATAEAKAEAGLGQSPLRGDCPGISNAMPSPAQANALTFTWTGDVVRLANHPGSGEGSRHATLCQLLGRELGLGREPEAIEAEALAWAGRCHPPMAEADVRRQLKSLGRKHQRKAEQQNTQATVSVSLSVGKEGSKSPAPAEALAQPEPGLTSFLPSFPSPSDGGKEGRKGSGPASATSFLPSFLPSAHAPATG